ncbi:MAG: NUMOD3 domain-containing DNA-binding protein [Kiritimatiellia bacterium]|nr:NUMOD3 domain-containing DNA-binding protein [Kiritimatiellia bacterium]
MKSGIYGIRNIVNGKWSIGQSIDIERRYQVHLRDLRKGAHYNSYFQRAFNKYGEANFEFRILEETEAGLLDIQERLWIAHYKSNQEQFGYNSENGGRLNKQPSEETRRKMSKALKGHIVSLETRRKISEKNKGQIISQEQRQRISKTLKGRPQPPRSKEHKKNLSEALKGKHLSEETRRKISIAGKLRKWSDETRQKFIKTTTGKHHSAEWCQNISNANKGKHPSEATKQKMRESHKKSFLAIKRQAVLPVVASLINQP